MKKTFSLSDVMTKRIEKLSKEQGTTQSRLVETALTIYMMIAINDPANAQKLVELVPKNQVDIFEFLGKK